MRNKNRITKKLATIPEVKANEKDVSKILQTLREENSGEDKKIKISFQFFNRENKLFNLGEIENEWFIGLLDVLQLLSSITRKQLSGEYSNKFHPHPYNNIDILNCKDSMLTNPQYEAWQLRLDKSSGRLHGFFVENTYYIRFIDRWHNMYNDRRYGGIKYKTFPLTEYDELKQKYDRIVLEASQYKEQNKQLKNSFNKCFEAMCNNCSNCAKADNVYKDFKL